MTPSVISLIIALVGIASCFLRLANARARERAGSPPPVRIRLPLPWALAVLLLGELLISSIFYTAYSHGFSVDGRVWFIMVVNTVAIVVIAYRILTRKSPKFDKLTQVEYRNGYSILVGIAGALIGACVSSFLITGQWFYPPKTTPPADVHYIWGFAILASSICVFASKKLFKRGEIQISE